MSSAAATRTSIGNGIREPDESIHERSRRMTSTTCDRGTAYSDSRKTTLRSEQKTLYDASTYSRAESARDANRLIRGTRPGCHTDNRFVSSKTLLDSSSSSIQPLTRLTGDAPMPAETRLLRLVSVPSVCGNQ